MSSNRQDKIFINVNNSDRFNSLGEPLGNRTFPQITAGEQVDFSLQFVEAFTDPDTFTPVTQFVSQTITSSAVIDDDFVHFIDGVLVDATLSGAITSIEISGLAEAPIELGFILLTNDSLEAESVEYTAVTKSGSNYIFTVSETLTFSYVAGNEASMSDPALVKSLSVDQTDKDTGLFIVTMNANTLPYLRAVRNQSEISNCQFEFIARNDVSQPTFIQSFDIKCFNTRDNNGVIPPPANGDYYTKAETDSILSGYLPRQSSNVDIGALLNSDDYFPVYNKDDGLAQRYKISDIATGTQVPPVQNVYTDITAMLADQGSQTLDYLQQAGTAFFKKLVASTADISDYIEVGAQESPIEGLYTNTANMILDQSNQTADYIQKAGVEYYHYLGTTVGDITDYQLIGSGGGGAVDSVFTRTGAVVALAGDYDASQITETATKKILTGVERTAIDLTNYTMTGVISGGAVTQNTSTTFDIEAGTGIIFDYSDPLNITKTLITWASELNVAIPDIGQPLTLLFVTGNNTIEKISRASVRTVEENRLKICLQVVIHNSGVQIDGFSLSHKPAFGGIDALLDYVDQNGVINVGNLYKANGANLRLDRDSGFSTIPFINISVNILDPVTKTDNAELAVLITPNYKDGVGGFIIGVPSLDVDADVYDDGSGTLANIPNNQYVNHRLTYFPDGEATAIQYGQVTYSTESAAISAILKESFDLSPILSTGSLTTFITLKKGESDLTNAVFTENVGSGGGGGSGTAGVLSVNSGTDITVDNTDPQNPIINFSGATYPESDDLFIHKAGSDSNDGLTPVNPLLTISDAILKAIASLPTESNQITINIMDSGTYVESPNLPEWVHIRAGNAALDGRLTVSDNTIVSFRRLQNSTIAQPVVRKTDGLGFAKIAVELLIVGDSSQEGLLVDMGVMHIDAGVISVDSGIGIKAKNGSRVSFIVSEVQLLNGGLGIGTRTSGGDPNFFSGNVLYAKDDGSGVLLESKVTGDIINVQAGSLIVDTLYDMAANTTLNIFATEATGSIVTDPSAVINSTIAGASSGGGGGAGYTPPSSTNAVVDTDALVADDDTNTFAGSVDGTVVVLDAPTHGILYFLYVSGTAQVRIENVTGDAIVPTVSNIDAVLCIEYDTISASYKVVR